MNEGGLTLTPEEHGKLPIIEQGIFIFDPCSACGGDGEEEIPWDELS